MRLNHLYLATPTLNHSYLATPTLNPSYLATPTSVAGDRCRSGALGSLSFPLARYYPFKQARSQTMNTVGAALPVRLPIHTVGKANPLCLITQ